jgi:putative radical SAM enzyme (TIGR03279 family)
MTPSTLRCAARVADVRPDSIAAELELQPGDLLLAINGRPVPDHIAYRFAIAEEEITLDVARGDEVWQFEIEKDADEDLGLVFDADLFDGMRRCQNDCVFCFESQMPDGMRAALSDRDDDFRLSFLHGNFVTLTNLRAADLARIVRDRLTPLFVSVHATDPAVRRRMMRYRKGLDVRDQLRQLGDAGIQVHAQIVLCPGWNDGAVLARTLDDLAALHPTVLSVGVVPVGLTAHRPAGPEVRAVTPDDARAALAAIGARQDTNLAALGTRLVFAADEFYLAAGQDVPPAEAYEGYPQRENGIGLARLFLDELAGMRLPRGSRRVTLVTGTLAAPLLQALAARLCRAGYTAEVVAVPNAFYGGGVSVAGLLTGRDIRAALAGRDLDLLFLPATTLNADGCFLDDLTPADLGHPAHFCAGPREVSAILRRP